MPEQVTLPQRLMRSQNLILYLIIAFLAYLLAVAFFSNQARSGGFNLAGLLGLNPKTTVQLLPQNESNEKGNAVIESINNGSQIKVELELDNAPGEPQPAHIHLGSCPNPGAVHYALNNVIGGRSETTLDVAYESLKTLGPTAINIHKSVPEQSIYVSCGNISF